MTKKQKVRLRLTNISVLASIATIIACILSILAFFIPESQKGSTITKGNNSPIILNNSGQINLDYSTNIQTIPSFNSLDSLTIKKNQAETIQYSGAKGSMVGLKSINARIDENLYSIVLPNEELCLEIIEERDFDGNGSLDALVANIEGCGGNCCPNTFFLISYSGNGHFQKSTNFGSSWRKPKVESWKGLQSILVTSHTEGINQNKAEEKIERYILDSGKIVKVEESQKHNLIAIAQLFSGNFEDDNQTKSIFFDLNSDGNIDTISGNLWSRWARITWKTSLSQGYTENNLSCKRIGILETKKNGVNNLVCDQDIVLQWDGKQYK